MGVPGGEKTQSSNNSTSLSHKLNSKTPILSLRLYAVIAIAALCLLAAVALLIFLCLRRNRGSSKRKMRVKHSSGTIPLVSKEITEIKSPSPRAADNGEGKIGNQKLKEAPEAAEVVDVEIGKGHRSGLESDGSGPQNIGWGRWYGLKELEIATRGFSKESVIGEGGYGIVYRGVLQDGSVVAVKNLLNNKSNLSAVQVVLLMVNIYSIMGFLYRALDPPSP